MLLKRELEEVRGNIETITVDDISSGKARMIPIQLKNGYTVTLLLDVTNKNLIKEHLIVKNPYGDIDGAESEWIAKDVLGNGYLSITHNKLMSHFMKRLGNFNFKTNLGKNDSK